VYPNTAPFSSHDSALGQTQKSECATGKSGLPSTTGIVSQTCQVRKVPILLQKSAAAD
jgi:hypothetical protein